MKTIYHLGGFGNVNIGDSVLQSATTKIMRDGIKKDSQFKYLDTQNTLWIPELIKKMNWEANLLLVGGGGFLFRSINPYNKSGWQFNIETDLVDEIKVPMAIYGIGFNRFPHDPNYFSLATWNNIEKILCKAKVVSVRNTGTYNILRQHGLTTDHISVVPDAGMFMQAEHISHPIFDCDNIKIGLNWATDRILERFGTFAEYINKLNVVLSVCASLCDKYNAKIYMFEHLTIKNEIHSNVKKDLYVRAKKALGENLIIIKEHFGHLYPPFEYYAGFFADMYRKMDIVMGVRGHSLIVPFGQKTPVIGLGQHNKVKYFLDDCKMLDMLVELNNSDQNDFDKLFELASHTIENNVEARSRIEIELFRFEEIKDKEIEKIARLI